MTQYPPPGAADGTPAWGQQPPAPAAPPPPGWSAGPQPGPQPGPYPGAAPWGPPVHQPGVVPLRPLTLGDIFGGSLQTMRRNPRATVGMAALVTLGFMLVPTLITLALGATGDLPSLVSSAEDSTSSVGDAGLLLTSAISGIFNFLASVVITGIVVRVVDAALVGRPLTVAEAWQLTRGRVLRLLGLSLLLGLAATVVISIPVVLGVGVGVLVNPVLGVLLGLFSGAAAVAALVFLYTRYALLAAPVLVLEGRGVFASLRRAGQLSRGQFWRLLGIALLAGLAAYLVGQMIQIPFSVIGVIAAFLLRDSDWSLVVLMLVTNLATVVAGAVVGPFTGGVSALQYVDQRFRKEGLDIALLNQTLQPGAPGPR